MIRTAPKALLTQKAQARTPMEGLAHADSIVVRRVKDAQDFEVAMRLRHGGYGRYGLTLEDVAEDLDRAPNATILIAEDDKGRAVGTMRILDRTGGPLELDRYVDLDAVLCDDRKLCAEATRLTVAPGPLRLAVKSALWKAGHRYCLAHQLTSLIAWVRPCLRKDYEMLLFEDLGDEAAFSHPLLRDRYHRTMCLDVVQAESAFRSVSHPFHRFFFCDRHPHITFA